jgi:uncharacterized protein YqjF (DUF2071 family)
MNIIANLRAEASRSPSAKGRERLLSRWGEPLFMAGWERTLFIHFEVDADALQRDVPFKLDLRDGRAYVSLVAFTMRDMRFRRGGPIPSLLLKPIATHEFLNVRTYVKHNDEPGIYFLTEWLSNWLSVQLGPLLYGLPYRYARIDYQHRHEAGHFSSQVSGHKTRGKFECEGACAPGIVFNPCDASSLDEFLVERYTAYTACGSTRRFFRIWHPPWPQTKVKISLRNDSLLQETWSWFKNAQCVGANYSPGFSGVWMGRAHRIK